MQSTKSVIIDKPDNKRGIWRKRAKSYVYVGDSMSPYLQHDDIPVYYPYQNAL